MIGKTISHYKIIEKLGEGGMGIVYKVKDTKLKRQVAIKFLPPRIIVNETDKARFLQEAQSAAAINHQNVCVIHEIQDQEENPFIVMEYIEGQSLSDKISSKPLPVEQVIDYAVQIGSALQAAHAKDIIHRDIKSDNIMVSTTNQIKVMDFGLAKIKGSDKITKTTNTVGTLAYMSPEQIEGYEIDARADIFSYGVVLYEMLTRELPFKGEYKSAIMYAIMNEEPESIIKIRPDCPDSLLNIITKCLQKKPQDRFQSMQKILTAFEATSYKVTEKKDIVRKNNLPVQLTSFIGREKVIETIKQLLKEHRLVTLSGAGGCGKTRLAIQTASAVLTNYHDGVWMVELAPLTVPEQIDQTVAGIFKVKEQAGSTLIKIITNYLKNKKLLLILDNCEHLITACSDMVEQILKSTTDVTILTTSREALNVADEVAWQVPSLSLPQKGKELTAQEIGLYEAIQLFVARAKNKQPNFKLSDQNCQTVLQICNRLDGIPLAIELAASRVNVFNPEHILSRLDNRFRLLTGGSRTALERHKTLQATIDWSYDLLSENEKKIFHRLSVFVGGFDLEAYEQICEVNTLENEDIIDFLTSLIEKSLVIANALKSGEYRYQLLETIRHYAKEKLLESGESDSIRDSHYQYYCNLSEQAYMENLEKYEYWVNKLELEHKNILAALEWVGNDIDKRLRLAGVLGWFWYEHSHYNHGIEYLNDIELNPTNVDLIKVRAISSYGWLLAHLGNPKGYTIFENSLKFWDELKNTREKAFVLYYFSLVKSLMADYRAAQEAATEINSIAKELKNDYLLLKSNTAQAFVHICQLQVACAEPLAEQNIRDAHALNVNSDKAMNIHFHADCALMRKDYKETEKRYSIAMNGWLKTGNQKEACKEMYGIAFALSGQGRYVKALRLRGSATAKIEEFGASDIIVKFWLDWIEEYIGGARKAVGEKTAAIYEQEGRQMVFEKAVEYALDFDKD